MTERAIEIIEDEPVIHRRIVKVRYVDAGTGEIGGREYTYYSERPLTIGDILTVPIKDTFGKAQVTAIDVPESEIAAFKDKVKMIVPAVIVTRRVPDPVPVEQGGPTPEPYEKPTALVVVERKADMMSTKVFEVHEITTPELHEQAEKWQSIVRIQLQDLERARAADVKKPNDYVRWINSKYREKSDLLKRIDEHLLKIIGAFRLKQRQAQEHDQEIADREAQRQFDREVAKGKTPAVPVPVSRKVEGLPQTAVTEEAKNIWGTEWDFEIVKPDLVPREYCIPDEKRIRQYAKLMKDKAVMAGVRFFEKPKVQVRRGKVEDANGTDPMP